MRCNDEGREIVKFFEGFRSSVYSCSAGVPTIGWGSTYYTDGTRVSPGDPEISKEQAEDLLVFGLRTAENAVARLVKPVALNENQFSSLVSFVYNIGSGNFQSSTLRQRLRRKDYSKAALEFPKWRRANGRILRGLVERRKREKALFLKC